MINVYAKPSLNVNPEHLKYLVHFVKFSCFILNFKEDVNIYLLGKGENGGITTGGYNPADKTITSVYEGRALVDVLRSIAHELEHQRQDFAGLIDMSQGVQNIGGFLENDANIIPGILIKLYVQRFKARLLYSI